MMKFIIIILTMVTLVSSEETVDIRTYTINNHFNYFLQVLPHMAVEVRDCNNQDQICSVTSYGKAKNGKIYSPDILTEGRYCFKKKCKPIPEGYNINYISNWNTVSKRKLYSFINGYKKNHYNFINNNCVTFVTELLANLDINLNCRKMGIIDFPLFCK